MSTDVRAGIIGPAGIGRLHRDALRRIGVEVSAVASSSRASAERHAAALGVPAALTPEELIAAVDVVHVCTPNNLHVPLVEAALASGKHVVCEKPLATSAAEAWRLVELAEGAGVVAASCYGFRYYAMPRVLRSLVAEGRLGEVHLLRAAFLLDEALLFDDAHWLLDPEQTGPSFSLADVGVHVWDMLEFVTGRRVVEVVGTLRSMRRPPSDDSDAFLLRLDGGAVAVGAVSQAAPGHKATLEVEAIGSEATGRWSMQDPDRLWVSPLRGDVQVIVRAPELDADLPTTLQLPAGQAQGWTEAFRDLMASIYAPIRGGESGGGYPTFADAARGVAITEAVRESAVEGRWTRVRAG